MVVWNECPARVKGLGRWTGGALSDELFINGSRGTDK